MPYPGVKVNLIIWWKSWSLSVILHLFDAYAQRKKVTLEMTRCDGGNFRAFSGVLRIKVHTHNAPSTLLHLWCIWKCHSVAYFFLKSQRITPEKEKLYDLTLRALPRRLHVLKLFVHWSWLEKKSRNFFLILSKQTGCQRAAKQTCIACQKVAKQPRILRSTSDSVTLVQHDVQTPGSAILTEWVFWQYVDTQKPGSTTTKINMKSSSLFRQSCN